MADQKITYGVGVADPNTPSNWYQPQPTHGVAITKSDSTTYNPPLKKLWVGGAGNVAVLLSGDSAAVTLTGATAGQWIEGLSISKVMSTNTTATLIVGFW